MAGRRPSQNAATRGTAVRASATLWIVSASKATEPLVTTMAAWTAAVPASATSEIFNVRIPSALASRAESIESVASWL